MKTTINNNQRVFQVTGEDCRQVFCNLNDVKQAVKSFATNIKVYEFWKCKPKFISINKLNEMLEANKLETI